MAKPRRARPADIHEHDHGEHAAEDGLADVEDVDVDARERDADSRDDADAVVPDDGDDCMHNSSAPFKLLFP